MARMKTIYKPGSKPDRRGKRPIKGWQIILSLPGRNDVQILFSRGKGYKENEVKRRLDVASDIEAEYSKRGAPCDEVLDRLGRYPDLLDRLVKHGIINPGPVLTLDAFFEQFLAWNAQEGVTARTLELRRWAFDHALEHFGREALITSISKQDAHAFNDACSGYKQSTRAQIMHAVKYAFKWGIRREYVVKNPFAEISTSAPVYATDKTEYITPKETAALMEQCAHERFPAEWRVLLALWRFQGLRHKEATGVKWEHVDLDAGIMTFASPKTARHGRPERTMPIFPDTANLLRALLAEQEPGAEYVVQNLIHCCRYRVVNRLFERAGLDMPNRPIHSMRASASTDIAGNPALGRKAESEWLGHSETMAEERYIKVTRAQIEAARSWSILEPVPAE